MPPNPPPHPDAAKPAFVLWRPFIAARDWLFSSRRIDHPEIGGGARILVNVAFVSLIVVMVASAFLYARPLYQVFKDWRANRLAAEAEALSESGENFQAVLLAQQAYILSPENEKAIRLNGTFFTLMKRSEALYFWDKLEAREALTAEDELLRIRALLNADRGKEARQELEQWITRHPPLEETIKLAREMFAQDDFIVTFLPKLKDYTLQHPDDKASRLRLASLQMDTGVRDEVAEAIQALKVLGSGTDTVSLTALEILSTYAELPPEEMYPLIPLLENHPRATAYHQVQALRLRLHLQPERRTSIIAGAVQRFQGSRRENLHAVVQWLVQENEHQQVVSLVSEETAMEYLPLLENYLTSLTALKRFNDLRRLVSDPRINRIITRSTAAFYQLHLDFVTGQPLATLRNRMETATLHAENEGRSEMLLTIGKYGEQRSMADLAEKAYLAAMRSRRTANEALDGVLRVTRISGNTAGHMSVLSDALRKWPDNQDYQEKLAYVQLLTGVQLETSQQMAETLAQLRPEDSNARLVAAMAAWRLRDLGLAGQHLRRVQMDSLPPAQRAVYAAIAIDCGWQDESRLAVRSMPADTVMFPQEKALFASLNRLP